MKKTLTLLLCFAMLFPLASCAVGSNPHLPPPTTEETTTAPAADGSTEETTTEAPSAPVTNEAVLQTFEAAINGEICVIDESLGEIKLKDCHFPGNHLKLEESIISGEVFFDLDRDGIGEYIVQSYSLDSVVLHYDNGKIYAFAFAFKAFNNLRDDGSFCWNGPADPSHGYVFDSGVRRLAFDGTKIKFEDISKTIYNGQKNAKHYIGDREVTYDEMVEYNRKNVTANFVEYAPFAAPWYKVIITEEEAVQIASEYWNIKLGDVSDETGFPFAILPKHSKTSNYCIALAWLVEGSHYSTVEMIEINAFTGEITDPNRTQGGK